MQRSPGALWLATLALVLICLLLAGCRYPRDPSGTLDRVTDGTLRVGLTDNPPWVIGHGAGAPTGVEVELLQQLAADLNSEIRWQRGSESELLAALEAGRIDVAIGGFREADPVKPVVGFTRPYHTARVLVGAPAGQPLPASLDGAAVAVDPLFPHVDQLRRKGARLLERDSSAPDSSRTDSSGADLSGTNSLAASDGLVAAPDWWLQAHGFTPGTIELGKEQYRLAVAPGENAWLLRLQRYLDAQQDVGAQLVAAERRR